MNEKPQDEIARPLDKLVSHEVLHNECCAFFSYVCNFLRQDAPRDQIFEELKRMAYKLRG